MKKPVVIYGTVVHGYKRGRVLGFPTANLELAKDIVLPKHGVYASKVTISENEYHAVTHIGYAKTFNALAPTVEVHIHNFHKDIYGETLRVKLCSHLREMKKFSSSKKLTNQLKKDSHQATRILECQ